MQKTIQKFRRSSIIFEKPGILSENLKTLTSSNYPTVQYFFPETSHTFSTYQCLLKGSWDFELFRSWIILKKFKRPGLYTVVFYTFIKNSRPKQNKKNPKHPFVDIAK